MSGTQKGKDREELKKNSCIWIVIIFRKEKCKHPKDDKQTHANRDTEIITSEMDRFRQTTQ